MWFWVWERGKRIIKISNEIICPICKELCEINFSNYKISLINCINKHCFTNLIINEFYDFQKIINEKKILCNQCKSNKFEAYNNKILYVVIVILNYVLYVKILMIKNI